MSLFHNNMLMSPAGGAAFDTTLIGNSVRLNGSNTFFNRDNFALSADGRKEFIFSIWVKRNEFGRAQTHFDLYPTGSTSYNDGSRFTFPAGDGLAFSVGAGGSSGGQKVSSAKYRDIGWYHVLISYNTNTSVTAASRHRTFVNGLEITDIGTYTAPPDNQSCIGSGTGNADLRIGKTEHSGIPYVPDAYFAQACYLEGKSIQAGDYAITDFLDSFTFGTNGSQYVPKADADIAALASTVGGASFCLDFADSEGTDAANLGNDISSNNNDFTVNSMAAANQSENTPSDDHAILNTLIPNGAITYSEGNTKITHTAYTQVVPATIFATSGKFYAEILIGKTGTWAGYNGVVPADDQAEPDWQYPTGDGFIWVSNGTLNHVSASPSVTTTYGNGDRLMFALDMDNGWLFIGKNDTWYDSDGNSFTDLTDSDNAVATTLLTVSTAGWTFAPGASHVSGTTTEQIFVEESSWSYTAPTNFVSLSSANLTAPDYQGIDYFKPVLYVGNGTADAAGGNAVTGLGWKPDLTWIKNRDATDDHALYDIVRGVTKQLESNTATAESTEAEGLTTFGSDGFTVGSLAQVNTNTEDYVSWNWLGSNSTATTSPAGSIASTSTVASAGHFSVGTYTGIADAGTVGHGLGGAPEMVIVWDKGYDNSIAVYHVGVASDAATDYLILSQTDAATDNAIFWNDTVPDSDVFSVGTGNNTNGAGDFVRPKSFLAFRSVPGVCKLGSYTGNANANGPYIDLGFKPAFFMAKSTGVENWIILDNQRPNYNPTGGYLFANLNNAEGGLGSEYADFLSSGIKLRTTGASANGSATFIYLAMADIGGNGTLPPIYGR